MLLIILIVYVLIGASVTFIVLNLVSKFREVDLSLINIILNVMTWPLSVFYIFKTLLTKGLPK